jgi:hypothetical protein
MMEAVHRYEARSTRSWATDHGLFGAPLAHEDHAVRVLRGAPDAGEREEVRGTGATLTRRWSRSASVKLGEVVVTPSAAISTWTTAIGTETHLAARMEQIADRRHRDHARDAGWPRLRRN